MVYATLQNGAWQNTLYCCQNNNDDNINKNNNNNNNYLIYSWYKSVVKVN